jgi:prepilin signal peptidase PulO-like enzyme (type II secretory pathway)
MEILIVVVLAVLGLCFGSFANAAVWRIKKRKDIVRDRSECPNCHHKLAWYDLLPVASWLLLRGRCRYCHKPISVQYPLVELAVAIYFVASYMFWPQPLEGWLQLGLFALWLVYGVALAILFVYDFRWYLLPDRVVLPLIAIAAAQAVTVQAVTAGSVGEGAVNIVLSISAIGGLYYVLFLLSRGKWVGFGDVKLGVFMGLALGWQLALLTVVLANIIGFLMVVPGMLSGKLGRTSRIPFGPLLILGFVLSGLWGQDIIDWYFNLLLLPLYSRLAYAIIDSRCGAKNKNRVDLLLSRSFFFLLSRRCCSL